jgi:hypothetical protein
MTHNNGGEIVDQLVEAPRRAIAPNAGRMSVTEVTQHVIAVQEVMKSLMKQDVHYGTIPGAGDKPTLLKSGAEMLCMTFRIADEYRIDDLSDGDVIRYRVTCIGRHQMTGAELGSGMGEGSTGEEKYRWRRAVCKEEFDATPSEMRRIKFGKKSGGFYTVEQVRTDAADLANTVLKMACKRAKIAMVLNVTAASDMFSQDLEDLDDVLREHLAEQQHDTTLRDEWVAKASAAESSGSLQAVWKEGVAIMQAAKDKAGYAAFKAAVGERGAQLKTQEAQ